MSDGYTVCEGKIQGCTTLVTHSFGRHGSVKQLTNQEFSRLSTSVSRPERLGKGTFLKPWREIAIREDENA